jgi:prefoldin subunit 5
MTIDERLEKLTERHEALTMNVELHDARMAKLEEYMGEMMQAITRLGNIAAVNGKQVEDHERRIKDLEREG